MLSSVMRCCAICSSCAILFSTCHLHLDDGGSWVLPNISTLLWDYVVLHLRIVFPIILMVINTGMKIQVFWDVTLCCLTSSVMHFEGIMILLNDGNCKANDTLSLPRNWIFNHNLVNEESLWLYCWYSSGLHSVWSTIWYV